MNPYRAVAERLEQRGWLQGTSGPEEGPNCLMAANRLTNGKDQDQIRKFVNDVRPIIVEQFPERVAFECFGVAQFNDHPNTTFEDVILVLDKAALQFEEQA